VPFVPLAGDMAAAMRTAAAGVTRHGADARYVARTLAGIAAANTGEWLRAALAHARGRDVVIGAGLAIYVALAAADALRIRAIGAGLQPMLPTRAFASPFLPPMRLPPLLNRASHRLVLSLMWRSFRGPLNAAQREVAGRPPRRREWNDYPVLFGVSPTLVPRPDDWTDRVAMTGYWFGPRDPNFVPDADLVAFIDADAPPVYVGFGSMLGFDREGLLDVVLRALDGRRAILHSGWSGFGDATLPANVRRVAHVPHDWLFPRMSTIVHHGGAGTTHTAARAGVPSVVLPFAADQFFWAKRVERIGIAPPMLTHERLCACRLRERLELAGDAALRARAARVGSAIAAETGVASGVAQIEAWMRESPVTSPAER
jgi:sterol 3beta-glucosyltransferase